MNRSRWCCGPASATRAAALVVFLIVSTAAIVSAQNDDQDAGLRTVSGTIVDKNEKPISDAVVYLKNVRTLTVRTYISNQDGVYRFSGLDPNVDYEIHAEHGGMTSNNRTVSSFDSRKQIRIILKIDKEKKKEK
jgi:hypothetical protein